MQTEYFFDKRSFLKLLTVSLIVNILWAFASTQLELLTYDDKGFITSVGFLIIYPLPFFILLSKTKRTFYTWLMLTMSTIVIFLISTFVIPMFGISIESKILQTLFLLFISVFSASLITFNVGRYFLIEFKKLTIVITSLLAFLVTIVFFLLSLPDKLEDNYFNVLSPLSAGFAIWQILTSAGVAIGITLQRPAANKCLLP